MPALTAIGRSDLAYELAVQTTYPSWGYMLKRGATTLWELWEEKTGPAMNSHDHAMFASVGAWFTRRWEGSTRMRRRRLSTPPHRTANGGGPQLGQRHSADGSRHGFFFLDACSASVTLAVAIPVGADARVVIPKPKELTDVTIEEDGRVIWEKGHFVSGDPGITDAKEENRTFVFDVGSGDYAFRLTAQ